mmetsp:Transcript_2698/g.7706  ORF Transcript_2698/g.7706 Transcript_2698/m.7706 type:complete len:267 (-) Transcript_2698:1723-2523(-)
MNVGVSNGPPSGAVPAELPALMRPATSMGACTTCTGAAGATAAPPPPPRSRSPSKSSAPPPPPAVWGCGGGGAAPAPPPPPRSRPPSMSSMPPAGWGGGGAGWGAGSGSSAPSRSGSGAAPLPPPPPGGARPSRLSACSILSMTTSVFLMPSDWLSVMCPLMRLSTADSRSGKAGIMSSTVALRSTNSGEESAVYSRARCCTSWSMAARCGLSTRATSSSSEGSMWASLVKVERSSARVGREAEDMCAFSASNWARASMPSLSAMR